MPPSNKTPQKKKRKSAGGSQLDFITFQSNGKAPTPLFCKTKASPGTPASSRKVSRENLRQETVPL